MIEKLTKSVEVVFDVTMSTIKNVLLALFLTFLALIVVVFGFVTMIAQILTK